MSDIADEYYRVEKIVGHWENRNPEKWLLKVKWIGWQDPTTECINTFLENKTGKKVVNMVGRYVAETFSGQKQLYLDNKDGNKVYSVWSVNEITKLVRDGRLRLVDNVMDPTDPHAERYEFQDLIAHKKEHDVDFFLVWWEGCRVLDSTWEPLNHLCDTEDSRDAVREFLQETYGGTMKLQPSRGNH